jgi:type VI protein secretion system component Hcp
MPTAVEMFLKIDGINGGSTAAGHEGEIELQSFNLGLTNTGSSDTGGGGGAGKVVFQDFHFTSQVGVQSPQIFAGAVTGRHFPNATLTFGAQNASLKLAAPDLKINFFDVFFTEYKIMDIASLKLEDAVSLEGGLITTGPVDNASFSFAKIEVNAGSQTTSASWAQRAFEMIQKEFA